MEAISRRVALHSPKDGGYNLCNASPKDKRGQKYSCRNKQTDLDRHYVSENTTGKRYQREEDAYKDI